MKLTRTDIDLVTGQVRCEVQVQIGPSIVTVPFTLLDGDLTAHAIDSGRSAWDNTDVVALGSKIVGDFTAPLDKPTPVVEVAEVIQMVEPHEQAIAEPATSTPVQAENTPAPVDIELENTPAP